MKYVKKSSKSFKKPKSYKKYGKGGFRNPTKKIFVKTVKQIVSKQAENKIMNFPISLTNMLIYTNGSWAPNQLIPISPYTGFANVIQGTGQNQRIGNQILIKKAEIKLLFNTKLYDLTTNLLTSPILIKIITFYDKTSMTVLPTGTPGLYQNGSGSSDPDVSSNIDILKKFNTDRYVIKAVKTIKLGNSIYSNTAGGSNAFQFHANNDFKLLPTYTLDYTKHLVKKVKYNDATVNPMTRGLFMALFIMNADGTALAGNQSPCAYRGFIEIQYEDM